MSEKRKYSNEGQMELLFEQKEQKQDDYIELFPGNWLYNASVIGFLFSLEKIEGLNPLNFLQKDGSVKMPKNIFENLKVAERYFSDDKISSIVGKAPVYRNYLQPSEKEKFYHFVKKLKWVNNNFHNEKCVVCNSGYFIDEKNKDVLREQGLSNFIDRIEDYNMIFNANFGPSVNEFPNAFWAFQNSGKICTLCSFLIIHSEISNINLPDRSKVFINAQSFRLMYYLNRIISKIHFGNSIKAKDLLTMSVVEYTTKTNVLLGKWSAMNIEIIIQKNKILDFFNLPYSTVQLISNKKIASLLSNIGEFKIFNAVVEANYAKITDLGYKLLQISNKNERNKSDWDFVNDNLFQKHNKGNLKLTAQKLFKLYALIQERIKTT